MLGFDREYQEWRILLEGDSGSSEDSFRVRSVDLRGCRFRSERTRSRSKFATPLCPFWTAQESGVLPSSSAISGLTSFRSNSIFTTSSCPFFVAARSGVRPKQSAISGLTPVCSNSILTTSTCPFS